MSKRHCTQASPFPVSLSSIRFPIPYPRLLLPALLVFLLASCSSLKVESDPPGANVVWSHDGLEPFHPWPVDSWEVRNSRDNHLTPFFNWGFYGDTFFVTVEKDGYLRPLPRPVQLYGFRHERLKFDLFETTEALTKRMTTEGKVLYDGRWVDPDAEGLTTYGGIVMKKQDAVRLEQRKMGLVEYNGEWMSPADAQVQERKDREAAGDVEWKDRWVRPEVAAAEKAIDDAVAGIAGDKVYPDLPPPKVANRTGHPESQLRLHNPTVNPVEFLISGPVSRRYTVAPGAVFGENADDRIVLPPGRYDIVAMPEGNPGEAHWGNWPLAGGVLLDFEFTARGDGAAPPVIPIP